MARNEHSDSLGAIAARQVSEMAGEIATLRARIKDLESAQGLERCTWEESASAAWDSLLNKDDRNSPEDYPDHCLITKQELHGYIREAVLSAAQGARVPEGYDTIAGNGCSQQSVKEMQPKPLEIEPNGRHEKARRDSDLKIRNCGQIGRRNEVLSSGMQRGERAVCAEGGEDYQVTNGAGEALNPPLAAAPPAPSAPSREPMTEAELPEIFGKHFRETYECEPKDALTTAMLNTILAALTEASRIGVVVTDEMVERAAQAAYESQTFASDLPWAEVKTDRWHRAARAALHSALGQGEE